MNYHSATIAQILARINKDILIPGIQRPYVWEPEQIIRLFDSLMRGYPINSFLFWELLPENFGDWDIYRFVRHFKHGDIHNERADVDGSKPLVLVLDGQQRLTSMLIGLSGSFTTRLKHARRHKESSWIEEELYLNLLESPHGFGDSDDDEIVVRDIHYGFRFVEPERRPKNGPDAIWFRVSDVMSITDRDQVAAAVERELTLHPDLPAEHVDTLRGNLTRLYEVIWENDCIAYYLEHDQSYDKVLDIFIRANDGGTKLSKSDLLMSMVTLRWERVKARDSTEELTYHLREVLEVEKGFDRDYLLRAGLFFNGLNFGFQLKNFTPRNIAIIEATWEPTGQALRMAADLFSRMRITGSHLTALNSVMLAACHIYKVNQGRPLDAWALTPEDESRLHRWLASVLFHGVLSGAANITMELYRRVLDEELARRPLFPIDAMTQRITKRGRVMRYDDEAIRRFCASEAKGRLGFPLLTLLYDRVDWRTESWQLVQVVPSHRLIDERLQSVGVEDAQIATYQSWAGRLANFAILAAADAREYHKLDFDDWVASRTPEFFRAHLLPTNPGLYNEAAFIDFVTVRRKLIAQRLQNLLAEPALHAVPADGDPAAIAA